ncbi:MAG: FAD-dependent monooxygenase [Anderseniella sp.]
MSSQQPYDAIIIGGGLAGLTCGLALSGDYLSIPLKTLIVDAGPDLCSRKTAADARGSAITRSSRTMLQTLGIWDAVSDQAQAFEKIVVTDGRDATGARPALLSFLEAGEAGSASAWMVENSALLCALIEQVQHTPGITFMGNTVVETFEYGSSPAQVTTTDGRTFTAPLIVAADGRNSRARQAANIETVQWDYGQSGIAMTVEHDLPHHGRAEEHFREAGPFAILPLSGNRSSIVWTEQTGDAKQLMQLPEREFLDEFKQRFGNHLGEVKLATKYAAWPLSVQIAKTFIGNRLALIGDAAHVIHPIAGLGFNLGLRDIAALSDCIGDHVRLGLDPGGQSCLKAYEQWRRADTLMVAAACDGLNRLFSNSALPIATLRQAGLQLVDRLPPLKAFFMDQAAGMAGRQPRLLRGEPD